MQFRGASPDLASGLAQQAVNDIADSSSGSFFEDVPSNNALECIQYFCRSQNHQSFQRLAYTQGIAAAAAGSTVEYGDCVEVLLPLVQQLARDHEAEIRSTAVKQLAGLGNALYDKDAERSMRDIEATLLVCAQQCAVDDEDEVSQAAILAFQQLVQLLPLARATAASKRAVDRLESHGSDDGTLAAVRLLAHTVVFWTPEALKRHVPRYVSRWASHREFAVREAAATCMSLVLPAMPLRLCHQVMLPAVYQLSRDQNWRVRRACALHLPRLADALHERPLDASTPTAAHPGRGGGNWQQEVEADQQLGCCSSKPSSCLSVMQRYPGEAGHMQATANLAAASAPQRNRSYPSLANRSPATTAQIMTKHPMHSSLIIDGLLSGSSSFSSMPGSPSGSSDVTSMAQDAHDDACSPHSQQQQQGSLSDTEQADQQQQPHAQCHLEQQAALLHDCWCALRQCMELLTADSSHWVKVAALSGLGPFLLQLPPCQLGPLLLGRFTSMAGSTVVIYEVSVALACAQVFGQLAVLLGPERWPDMRDAWHALQASRDPAVLCEVVNCLPQLMASLGPILAHREMLPALAGLLQSHLGWVGGHLVQVMADLVPHLPPSGHDLLLKTLPQLASSSGEGTRSWRVRRDLALQLGRLAAVAGPEAIENSLWPTAMSLCCDPIAAVRTAAASQIGPILAALPSHMLQSQLEEGSSAGSCEACSSSRLGRPSGLCQQSSSCTQAGAAAPEQGACAYAAADGAAVDGSTAGGVDRAGSHSHASSSHQDLGAGGAVDAADSPQGVHLSRRSSSGRRRSAQFSVRFSLDDDAAAPSSSSPPNSSRSMSNSSSSSSRRSKQASRTPSLLSGLVANRHSSGLGSISSSGMEFDELALPSALAPAPAGCFSALSDASSDDASDDDAADADGSGSSGLSSSSSRSSGAGSHHSDSSSDESGNDSGNDSDSEGDEADSSHGPGLDRWREPVDASQQQHPGSGLQGVSDTPHEAGPTTAAGPQPLEERSAGSPPAGDSPVAASSKPLYAMHPAMMPVGALSAAAAVSGSSSAPLPVPASQRRTVRTRAQSTGDLLRLQHANVAASNPEDHHTGSLRGQGVVGRFQQQHGVHARHLPDSLPNTLLAADGNSSDDEAARHSSSGGWAAGLPEPALAAPNQYLPVLLEYFGCSSSHQQRQLFVPLVMGLLACCHNVLSCAQQAVLLDRLEALAHDAVPGVRYAVAAALADVRAQAAALSGHQPVSQQQQEEDEQSQVDLQAQQQHEEATGGVHAQGIEEQHHQAVCAAQGVMSQSASEDAGQQDEPQQPPQEHQPVNGAALQQQQQDQQQQDEGQQQQWEVEVVQQQPPQEPQVVGHVPKGAHPLLGYQLYVQQLASVSTPSPKRAPDAADNSSSSGGSGGSRPSPSLKVSVSGLTTANGRAPPAPLPPRSSASGVAASSSGGSRNQGGRQVQQRSGAAGGGYQHSLAATAAHPAGHSPSKLVPGAAAAAGHQGATAGAAAAAEGGGDAPGVEAAEWLRKLSNCQQLERLMHVVALTTGPL